MYTDCKPRKSSLVVSLLLTVALAAAVQAEALAFQIALADVPGTPHLAAGRLDEGIRLLEDRLADPEVELQQDERATLCAAYIVAGALHKAARTCQEAVEVDNSVAAYNNRGVYRAHAGDISGALDDFDRIRESATGKNDFVAEATAGNARRMAAVNFALAEQLQQLTRRQVLGLERGRRGVRGASIENIEG